MPKITLIGAGSVEFTRVLLGDLLRFPELANARIALHDIDPERLATAEQVARWAARATGASPAIEVHADRRAALDGADYAINMIQVGGYAASVVDFEVPTSYGLRQTVADTLGIGGIFRALRTIPVMQAIAADMAELCPDAWLLNYTNPMAMLCWALALDAPDVKAVGLCHSVFHTAEKLAGYVGVPLEEVTYLAAGVNHQSFMYRFERDGESLYPLLDEAIARDPQLRRTVRVELYRRFGWFPTESSEHGAEYLPWLMRSDAAIDRFRIEQGVWLRMSEDNEADYAQMKRQLADGTPLELEPSPEYAPQIVHSIETGQPRVVYGTVPNTGLIDNLPAGAAVEVPCAVDGSGVHPVHVGALPAQCAALNRTFLNVCELAVRAAVEQRPEHVLHAAMLDPNAAATLSLDEIAALCGELVRVHGERLPAWLREADIWKREER
ncbi:alpha-glucosidase/alpha-galactosidase [Conexibacter woesei]|uniref:Glycoside hydrolase family 4 n=1 Tax=Conexibacter woesei (strain DSM 14684 / CCUG 47730 / CIP 108061 / JCM 11494 / NBRC 100937 / ID131577) TaxID=469383 RepID=D3F3L0_CONWI|nr:alpha-glucosidase/alpha-galactosidase [Conexibacter woesei]ADB52375.1 glycoside hydrolase family 4 [Conexibacter woesei DSM 14684]